jgi:hypothetical protein
MVEAITRQLDPFPDSKARTEIAPIAANMH